MSRTLIISILILLGARSYGQYYPMEAGVTGGLSSGMTFRAFLNEELSYEAQLSFRTEGLQFNLLRQVHREIEMTEHGSLYFVHGFGAHTGFYYSDTYTVFFREINFNKRVFSPVLGLDGYAGIEYRFYEAPISLGFRYQPFMELSLKQIFGINFWDFGFTFKYRFSYQNGYY